MAEFKEPRTLGSTTGAGGTATYSTETNSSNTEGIVGRVREQAKTQLSSQKDRATDGLGSVAQAVRETTKHLRDGQHDTVARYAEQTADQLERFTQRLKNKDIGELMTDVQQLARRQPALFVGGAFAIGLLSARFLKSSSSETGRSFGNNRGPEYGGGSYGYGNAGYQNTGYGNTGYGSGAGRTNVGTSGSTGYGSNTGSNTSVGLGSTGSSLGSSADTGSTTGQGTRGGGENAYGNRVPGSARKASSSKRTDNSTEEL